MTKGLGMQDWNVTVVNIIQCCLFSDRIFAGE